MEIFWNEEWGDMSDSSWTDDDANVVCRQLFGTSGTGIHLNSTNTSLKISIPFSALEYETGSGVAHIGLSYRCRGYEAEITFCVPSSGDVTRAYPVGVRCERGQYTNICIEHKE